MCLQLLGEFLYMSTSLNIEALLINRVRLTLCDGILGRKSSSTNLLAIVWDLNGHISHHSMLDFYYFKCAAF